MSPPHAPALALRDRLLDATLPIAGSRGWNGATLAGAAAAAGMSKGEAELAAPRGAGGLIEAWSARSDAALAGSLRGVSGGKIRERVTRAVRLRIEMEGPNREAAKRAAAHLAVNPARATAMAWRTADAIWRALGDASTDGNFYSKRAILAGVFSSTFTVWLTDDAPGQRRTWDFLDARIANVMQFERFKQTRLAPLGDMAVNAVGALARARYARQAREDDPA